MDNIESTPLPEPDPFAKELCAEISVDLDEVKGPKPWLLADYVTGAARNTIIGLERELRTLDQLRTLTTALADAILPGARTQPQLAARRRDWIWSLQVAIVRRDRRVITTPAWFVGNRILEVDLPRDAPVTRHGCLYVYHGSVATHVAAELGVEFSDAQKIYIAEWERLKPPPTAEERAEAEAERRHQQRLAAEHTRAVAEEAWRAEQRAEQQRQRQAAAKERRQRQEEQDRLLAALRHKKRSHTKTSKPRGRPRDPDRMKKVREAIRKVFPDQGRKAYDAEWWKPWNKESWVSKLGLLCSKFDESKVSHGATTWTDQLRKGPDGLDLVLRAIRYALTRK